MTSTTQLLKEVGINIAKSPREVVKTLLSSGGEFKTAAATIVAIPSTIVGAFKESAASIFTSTEKADPYASLENRSL